MDRTTLTRNLKPLKREGLVRIIPGKDRRAREVALTIAGQEALGRAFPRWKEAQGKIAARLGRERASRLLRLSLGDLCHQMDVRM